MSPMSPRKRSGFTLVELSLAMAFLAILLITIAVLVVRITTIYQTGLTIRAISSTGRQLIDDLTRSIAGSPIVSVTTNPTDPRFSSFYSTGDPAITTSNYFFEKRGTIDSSTASVDGTDGQLAGAFCTGLYTYIWNTAYALESETFSGFTYEYDANPDPDVEDMRQLPTFRLIRIPDNTRSICTTQREVGGQIDPSVSKFEAPPDQREYVPTELLGSTMEELALYDFRIFPASSNRVTGHIFYSGTFILATIRGGVDIFTTGDFCTEPVGTLNTDFAYCAINKFNFAMRATGETEGTNSNVDKGFGN